MKAAEAGGPRAGFTLIELLVVIPIIAILASMLLPALARAKTKSESIKCVSNLKQLGVANFMYANDSGKTLPYNIKVEGRGELWMTGLMINYAKVDQVRLCPTAPYRAKQPSGSATSAWVWGSELNPTSMSKPKEPKWIGSYALNGWMYAGDWPDAMGLFPSVKNAFRTEADFVQPSRTPVFSDSMWVDAWPQAKDVPAANILAGDSGLNAGLSRIVLLRHGSKPSSYPKTYPKGSRLPGGVNLVFIDGHAEPVPLQNLWDLYWHKGYEAPAKPPI